MSILSAIKGKEFMILMALIIIPYVLKWVWSEFKNETMEI